MSTNFPAQIDTILSLPTVVDNVTPFSGVIVNRLRDAIINIETELGIKPSSVYGTVKVRLDTLEAAINSGGGHSGDVTFAGDLAGFSTQQTVVGIQGSPILNSFSAGQFLIENSITNGLVWSSLTGDVTSSIAPGVITVTHINGISISSSPSINQILVATSGTTSNWQQITNSQISSSAAISVNKLSAGTSAQVLLNNNTPSPTWTSISGDITLSNIGTTSVIGIQNISVPSPSGSNTVLTYNSGSYSWSVVSGGSGSFQKNTTPLSGVNTLNINGRVNASVSSNVLSVNGSDYVIIGDGVTDNTIAFSEAVYKFRNNGGKIVLDGETRINFNSMQWPGCITTATDYYVGFTGAKTGSEQCVVNIVLGGIIGTATFRVSKDNGTTWGSTIPIPTSLVYPIPATSLTVQFDYPGNYLTGQTFYAIAAGVGGLSTTGYVANGFTRVQRVIIRGRLTLLHAFTPLPLMAWMVWEGDAGAEAGMTVQYADHGQIVPMSYAGAGASSLIISTASIPGFKWSIKAFDSGGADFTMSMTQATKDWLDDSVGRDIVLSGYSTSANNGTCVCTGWDIDTRAATSAILLAIVKKDSSQFTAGEIGSWSLNGRTGSALKLGDAAVLTQKKAFHVTGFTGLNHFHAKGSWLGLKNTANASSFDAAEGIVVHKLIGIDGIAGTGVYCVNEQIMDAVEWTPPTLPDANNGGITACIVPCHVRAFGQNTHLKNILVYPVWGVGVLFEGTSGYYDGLAILSAQASNGGSSRWSVPIIIDGSYEWVFRRLHTQINTALGPPNLPTANVLMTSSLGFNAFNGYGLFDGWTNYNASIVWNYMTGIFDNGATSGPLCIRDYFSEGQATPLIDFDTRQSCTYQLGIELRSINMSDGAPYSGVLASVVPCPPQAVENVVIDQSTFDVALVNTNLSLGISGIRTYEFGGYDLGSARIFSDHADGIFDEHQLNTNAELGPITVRDAIEWLPIVSNPTTWSSLVTGAGGTFTVEKGISGVSSAAKIHYGGGGHVFFDIAGLSGGGGSAASNWGIGDYIICGFWARTTDATLGFTNNSQFQLPTSGTYVNNAANTMLFRDYHASRIGGDWKLIQVYGKVTAVLSSSPSFSFLIDFNANTDLVIDRPFAARIPNSANMPASEAWRLARHICHFVHGSSPGIASLGPEQGLAVGSLGIQVSGKQVITVQQPAINDATGAGDVVAQLNALLAVVRTHGLISTFPLAGILNRWISDDAPNGGTVWPPSIGAINMLGTSFDVHTSVLAGHSGVRFNGSTQTANTASSIVHSNPTEVWVVAKIITWVNNASLVGVTGGSDAFVAGPNGTTPQLGIYAGTAWSGNVTGLTVGAYSIIRIVDNGASSALGVDAGCTSPTTIAGAGTNPFNGTFYLASYSGSSLLNCEFVDILIVDPGAGGYSASALYLGLKGMYGL